MPRALALSDFALLACHLELVPEADDEQSGEAEVEPGELDSPGSEEDGIDWAELHAEGVRVRYFADEDGDEFVLIANATSEETGLPYNFDVVVGARFQKPDPPVTLDEARATLLFLAYPYLRETVSNLTFRTPYPAFLMPALSRLPHPRVRGEDASE